MRPEVFSPQPDSGINVLLANGLRLGAPEHGPVQVGQRATQSQDMGGAFGSPFPSAAVQICLLVPERPERSQRPRGPQATSPRFVVQIPPAERSLATSILPRSGTWPSPGSPSRAPFGMSAGTAMGGGTSEVVSAQACPAKADHARRRLEHPGPGNLPPPGSIHPHMLRHACGFKLANDGHDTRALQHYLGHKHIQHTVRYTEMARGPVQEFLALTGAGKLGTTFGRCVFQCADAPPKSCLISCKEIGHGRNVGQSFRAHCSRHCKRAQLTGPDMFN